MDFILSYYRNPIFGILVLISIILIIALAQMILANLKESSTNKNIKKYLANYKTEHTEYLNVLNYDELLNLAKGFFKANMYLECKQVLIKLLNDLGSERDLLYLLALCDLRLGLLNEAKQDLLKILKSRARDEEALLCLAYIHFKLNELNECVQAYKCLNVLKDYEKEIDFLKNFKALAPSQKAVSIDGKAVENERITNFYLCKYCSAYSLFFTAFCPQCFRCDCLQANLRIKL